MADCDQIWYVVLRPSGRTYPAGHGWDASASAHVHAPFLYLGNGWTRCAEIWYVVEGSTGYARHASHGWGIYICLCAHEHIFSVFREQLDALC